jgi:hypothetical protein
MPCYATGNDYGVGGATISQAVSEASLRPSEILSFASKQHPSMYHVLIDPFPFLICEFELF